MSLVRGRWIDEASAMTNSARCRVLLSRTADRHPHSGKFHAWCRLAFQMSSCSFIVALPEQVSSVAEADNIIDAKGVAGKLWGGGVCGVDCLLDLRRTVEQLKDFPGLPCQTQYHCCPACQAFRKHIEHATFADIQCYLCNVEAIQSCVKLREWAVKHSPLRKPESTLTISPLETRIPPTCHTSRLPVPLLANIWSFLPLSCVLASVQVVCRHWRDLISSNNNPYMTSFWRQQGMHFLSLLLHVCR